VKPKSRLFLFAKIVKYTRHEMFVKLLISSLGWRCVEDTLCRLGQNITEEYNDA